MDDGGLCSSSEQTRIVTGRMVGCVPVLNKQGEWQGRMVGCVPVQNKQGEWQGRMVGCVPVQNKQGE